MGRRSAFSRKRSTGPSTLHQRDDAARAIAERVLRWRWETDHATTAKARAGALEKLGADLGPLAEQYRERDRTHQSLTIGSIAVADGAGLLVRLQAAPWGSPQRERVRKAAEKWLTSPAQRVRVGAEGRPVVLRMAGRCGEDELYGSREGRSAVAGVEESLRAPRAETFEPFIGPELPPDHGQTTCYCEERHAFIDCPFAQPCEGGCGTPTKHGYRCRYCANRTWVAAAWLVPSKSTVPSYAAFMTGVAAEAGLELSELLGLTELLQRKAAELARNLDTRHAAAGGSG